MVLFSADVSYHLFDQFKVYLHNLREEKKREAADEAVLSYVLKILPKIIFNCKDTIVLGVDALEGIAKVQLSSLRLASFLLFMLLMTVVL